MIDFRYHLVSIIAVFLALAIGLVIGANELQPTTEKALSKAATEVKRVNASLTQQNKNLQQQVTADQAFAQAASGRLLGHLLKGQSAVLVTAPGASSQSVTGITAALQKAGAKVTGQLSLQSQFFDASDSTEAKLTGLAQSLAANARVTLSSQPASNAVSAQAEAAQLIAAAVLARDGVGLGLTSAQSQAILGGLSQSGYLQLSAQGGKSGTALAPATMAVVVAPATPPCTSDGCPANLALIAAAQQLRAASHQTVLVAPQQGSGPGSAIQEVSGSGKVGTVDDVDQAVGQIVTVQALWELLAGHAPASYGVGPGAVPSPAPTPSVTPTTTPAHHVRPK